VKHVITKISLLTNLKVSVTIFHTCENSYIFYLQLTRKRSVIGDGIMT
jgi:predicted thioredoxin/glutaredoxin